MTFFFFFCLYLETAKPISAFAFATQTVQPASVAVPAGLCRTWSETQNVDFLMQKLDYIFLDFDECHEQDGAFHDCSPFAWCLNTQASYMCSCRKNYSDISPDFSKRPGRICIGNNKHRMCSMH